jgi:membrane protein
MNTSTLHRSSFGRIYLLTVEGFFSSLRPLLIFHAIMAVAFFGFPFLTLFLTRGFNIQEAFLELAGVYATGGVIGPYLIGTIIYILIWINKCVHKPSPGAYTQIPASAGEKMISIALLSLGYYLISLLSTLIISGIFGIFVPGGFSNVLEWALPIRYFYGLFSSIQYIAIVLGALHLPLLVTLCMIHFRKAIFGLCAAAFVEFSGFLIFLTIVLNFEEEIYRYSIEHPLTDRDYAWIVLIFFGLIDLFLTWAIYHRLKTIQIK